MQWFHKFSDTFPGFFFFHTNDRTPAVCIQVLRPFSQIRITLPPQPISHVAIKRPHSMITEGSRINLTLLDASVKEGDSHVAESCSMRQTNRRENYVHARGDPRRGGRESTRGGQGVGGRVTSSSSWLRLKHHLRTDVACREPLQGEGEGELQRRERGSLRGN